MIETWKESLFRIFLLLLVCVVCMTGCCPMMRFPIEPGVKIEKAARNVGVAPTMDGLAEYVNQAIAPGMSREQVEQALGKMAPCKVDRDVLRLDPDPEWHQLVMCDDIRVKLESPLQFSACYDTEGKLIHFASGGSDDPIGIDISVSPEGQP